LDRTNRAITENDEDGDAEQFAMQRLDMARTAWMALMSTPKMGITRIWKAMNRLESAK
jgi:hypothetical protein